VFGIERKAVFAKEAQAPYLTCQVIEKWRATADEDGHYSLAIPL
jgi:hypothetical protein